MVVRLNKKNMTKNRHCDSSNFTRSVSIHRYTRTPVQKYPAVFATRYVEF